MGQHLYVKQETVPLAEVGKEVMFVFRDPVFTGARPIVYVTALQDTTVQVRSGNGADTDSYTEVSSSTAIPRGQVRKFTLPISGAVTQLVSVVRVLAGTAAISISSPMPVTTEFRTRKHP